MKKSGGQKSRWTVPLKRQCPGFWRNRLKGLNINDRRANLRSQAFLSGAGGISKARSRQKRTGSATLRMSYTVILILYGMHRAFFCLHTKKGRKTSFYLGKCLIFVAHCLTTCGLFSYLPYTLIQNNDSYFINLFSTSNFHKVCIVQ